MDALSIGGDIIFCAYPNLQSLDYTMYSIDFSTLKMVGSLQLSRVEQI